MNQLSPVPITDTLQLAILYAILELGDKARGMDIRSNVETRLGQTFHLDVFYDALVELLCEDRVKWRMDPTARMPGTKIYSLEIPDDMVAYGPLTAEYPQIPLEANTAAMVLFVNGMKGHPPLARTAWAYGDPMVGLDVIAYTKINS